VKGLLDVADNLDRAYTNIQEEVAAADAGQKEMSQERAFSLLKSLLDGVRMTDNILLKVAPHVTG
jgi:molecular chaperone GrpE (heat shock protein)